MLLAGADVMLSGKLTMGAHVSRFESELAAYYPDVHARAYLPGVV